MEENIILNHSINIDNRKKIEISGVKDVLAFDDETILLNSVMGKITIKGSKLRIAVFKKESGDLSAEGIVHALVYLNDDKSQTGFFSKLFK